MLTQMKDVVFVLRTGIVHTYVEGYCPHDGTAALFNRRHGRPEAKHVCGAQDGRIAAELRSVEGVVEDGLLKVVAGLFSRQFFRSTRSRVDGIRGDGETAGWRAREL